MRYEDFAALEPAGWTAIGSDTSLPDNRTERLVRLLTAVVPAIGILAACALVLVTIV
jgi:hypothetical protein